MALQIAVLRWQIGCLDIGGWSVAKPEWGAKRQCQECEVKFYDLGKTPIICPDCGTEFKVVVAARPAPKAETKEAKPPPKHDRRKRGPEDDAAASDDLDDDEVDDDLDDDDIDLDDDDDDDIEEVIDSGKSE